MDTIAQTNTPRATLKRIVIVVGVIALVVGAGFLVTVLMRGTGKHEREIAQAVFASLGQDNMKASFDLSQQGQVQAMTAKGSFSLQDRDMYQGQLDVSVGQEESAVEVPIKVAGSAEQSQLYIRLSNSAAIIDTFGAQTGEAKPMLDSIAQKINDKWVRVEQQDSGVADCTGQLFSALSDSKEAQSQMTDAYIAHRFIVVREAEQRGDLTEYTVTTDRGALGGFFKALKSKDFFKKQDACNASYDPLGLEEPAQAQAPQQTGAAKAPQSPLVITVNKKGLISSLSLQQRGAEGVVSAKAGLSYASTDPISLPDDDVIEFSSIASEVEQVVGAVSRQQQALNQQPTTPQMR